MNTIFLYSLAFGNPQTSIDGLPENIASRDRGPKRAPELAEFPVPDDCSDHKKHNEKPRKPRQQQWISPQADEGGHDG